VPNVLIRKKGRAAGMGYKSDNPELRDQVGGAPSELPMGNDVANH